MCDGSAERPDHPYVLLGAGVEVCRACGQTGQQWRSGLLDGWVSSVVPSDHESSRSSALGAPCSLRCCSGSPWSKDALSGRGWAWLSVASRPPASGSERAALFLKASGPHYVPIPGTAAPVVAQDLSAARYRANLSLAGVLDSRHSASLIRQSGGRLYGNSRGWLLVMTSSGAVPGGVTP